MPQIWYNTEGGPEPGADEYLLVQVEKGKRVQRNGITFYGDEGALMVVTEALRRRADQGKKYGRFYKVLKHLDDLEINTVCQCRSCGVITLEEGFEYLDPGGDTVSFHGLKYVSEKDGDGEDAEDVVVPHCPHCDSTRIPTLLSMDAEYMAMEEEKRQAKFEADARATAAKTRRARKKK